MNSPVPTWITNNRTWETWNGKHPFFPGKRHVLRSRRILAEKWRQKISKSLQGNTNLLGYRHSIETKRKMSESHQKRAKLDAEIASLQQSLV